MATGPVTIGALCAESQTNIRKKPMRKPQSG